MLAGLPPLHGGLVGYLGYDVVREVEHLPDPPADDLGHPDAALVVIGQFCAFDHWRQRIVLVDNVRGARGSGGVRRRGRAWPRPTTGAVRPPAPAGGGLHGRVRGPGELVPAPPPGLEQGRGGADA